MRQRRPEAPPIAEPRLLPENDGPTASFSPAGVEIAGCWHAKPRQCLFVPGHCAGGPELNERTTYAKFPSGQVRVVQDNYLQLSKPAQVLADREWKGRTELKMRVQRIAEGGM